MTRHYPKILLLLLLGFALSNCKKANNKSEAPATNQQQKSALNNFESFAVNGQLFDAEINVAQKNVLVMLPQETSKQNLAITFKISAKATASINNTPVTSGALVNLTNPVPFIITAEDGSAVTYTITAKNKLDYYGLGTILTEEKSLNRTYNYYIDQMDGSRFQSINCGPTVTSMAMRWADASSKVTPEELRNQIRSTGGWWYTSDIQTYLTGSGIKNSYVSAANLANTVKTAIDNNNLLILCLDMYPVTRNTIDYQHTEKFYNTATTDWGHFLLVKGYKIVNNTFYLEINDPNSNNVTYTTDGQLKGRDRYYSAAALKTGVDIWWPYAIVVQAKGSTTTVTSGASKKALSALQVVNPPAAWGR